MKISIALMIGFLGGTGLWYFDVIPASSFGPEQVQIKHRLSSCYKFSFINRKMVVKLHVENKVPINVYIFKGTFGGKFQVGLLRTHHFTAYKPLIIQGSVSSHVAGGEEWCVGFEAKGKERPARLTYSVKTYLRF